MKKIIVLVMTLVMIFSLTACGGEEIEITMDNVNDYFEIKELREWDKNNVTVRYAVCIKEEYTDRLNLKKTDISFGYAWKERDVRPIVDFENKIIKYSEYHSSLTTDEINETDILVEFNADCFDKKNDIFAVTTENKGSGLYKGDVDRGMIYTLRENHHFIFAEGILLLK